MGQLDDEDKQYLIVDKDTGRVYDIRNEKHIEKISCNVTRRLSVENGINNSALNQSVNSSKAWNDWWKEKRKNEQDFLAAAENGNLEEVRKLLNPAVLHDLVADINVKGLDQWTALHFAANEGKVEVVKELLSHRQDIEKEPRSSIMRTPLHLAAIRGHTGIVRLLVQAGAD